MKQLDRREFLRAAATLSAAGVAGISGAGTGVELPLEVPDWTRTPGYYPPLYGFPPHEVVTPTGERGPGALPGGLSYELTTVGPPGRKALREIDPQSPQLKPEYHTPIQLPEGVHTDDGVSYITDNGLFYIIAHARIPIVPYDEHLLLVHGDRISSPKVFTMDDLMRFPKRVTATHFLECSGNTYQAWSQESSPDYSKLSVQLSHGLLSGIRWTGIPLRSVLECVGLRWTKGQKEKLWVLAEGADGAVLNRSIPIEKAMGDAILAFEQNGRPLQRESGYPLRLVLPGYEGNTNVKWVRRIKVGRDPWMTKEETASYTDYLSGVPSGDPARPGLAWQFTLTMEVKSVIVAPSAGQTLEPPRRGGKVRHEIRGFAWSGRGKVTRVEVRAGDGAWLEAQIPPPDQVLPIALTPFRFTWEWDGRPALLSSRATDESGMAQVDFQTLKKWRGIHSSYHYNGIQTWAVSQDGEVTNHAQVS